MSKELKLLGLVSLAIGIWKIYGTTYGYLYGPPTYDPRLLYILILPRWYFFMPDWICYGSLFLAGVTLFYSRPISFYLYHFFMIGFAASWIIGSGADREIWVDGWLLLACLAGIYACRKPFAYREFNRTKKLGIPYYLLFVALYWMTTQLPLMIF